MVVPWRSGLLWAFLALAAALAGSLAWGLRQHSAVSTLTEQNKVAQADLERLRGALAVKAKTDSKQSTQRALVLQDVRTAAEQVKESDEPHPQATPAQLDSLRALRLRSQAGILSASELSGAKP